MENKYHTPKIEEFHVGFDCEVFNFRKEIWEERKIRHGEDLCEIVSRYTLDKSSVRIKI